MRSDVDEGAAVEWPEQVPRVEWFVMTRGELSVRFSWRFWLGCFFAGRKLERYGSIVGRGFVCFCVFGRAQHF